MLQTFDAHYFGTCERSEGPLDVAKESVNAATCDKELGLQLLLQCIGIHAVNVFNDIGSILAKGDDLNWSVASKEVHTPFASSCG